MYFSIDFCLPGLGTNQNLSCWGNAGQSEDQLLGTTGTAVTCFSTKPPTMPYFSEYSSLVLDNLRLRQIYLPKELEHRLEVTLPCCVLQWCPLSIGLHTEVHMITIRRPWELCHVTLTSHQNKNLNNKRGENIITVGSALFKFNVAKISNLIFYSKSASIRHLGGKM